LPLRLVFMGTPDFAVPTLLEIVGAGHQIVAAFTRAAKPANRGMELQHTPIAREARQLGIPIFTPKTLKGATAAAIIDEHAPDAAVVVAYGLILPKAVLDLFPLGCFNLHASLLPRWRGAAPIQRAILAGDATSGVTIMLMDVGLDTGPMLLRKEVPIESYETGGSLHDRLSALGGAALIEALEGHAAGTLHAIPQPAEGVTYAAKLEKAEALIDWTRDAVEIERQVRAFNPWPIAETRLDGEQLRVFEARAGEHPLQQAVVSHAASVAAPITEDHPGEAVDPGTIIAVRDDALVVQCGLGRLALRQLQRPGRRVVAAADLARGLHLTGRRLG